MKKFSQICLFSIFLVFLFSNIVKANNNSIIYNKTGGIFICSKAIKYFKIEINPKMYVFNNSYGYFAILDVQGQIYPRQRIKPRDKFIKKITVSQYKKNRVRISIKLNHKLNFRVKYSEKEKLVKIYFLKKIKIPLKKKKTGLKNKKQKKIIVKKIVTKKMILEKKKLPAKTIMGKSKQLGEKFQSKDDSSAFSDIFNSNDGLPLIPEIPETKNAFESRKELFGIHSRVAFGITNKSKQLKLELKKTGVIENTTLSYNAKVWLKTERINSLDVDLHDLYIDGSWGENTSFRFGFDNGVIAGDSVMYFNGIEAFFPKDTTNLFFSDIEAARMVVPEIMLSYTLNDTTNFEFLWQLKNVEHDLGKIKLLGNDLEYKEENSNSYFKDSNIFIGCTKRFETQSIDLELYYRNGLNLFPDYKLGIDSDAKIFAEKIKNRYHTFMGSITKVYNNLNLNTEFVWNINKTVMNSFGKCKRENSLDIIGGVGYTFPQVDTKLQIEGNFEQKNNASATLWLKPSQVFGIDSQLTLAYNNKKQKLAQLGLSKRIGGNFEVTADFSVIDRPENKLARKLGKQAKLEFKFYF